VRIFNSYILIVSIALLSTTIILAALGQQILDIYYTLYIIEALIITELYVYLNARARRSLNAVSLLLFGGFLIIIVQQVAAILA
jgi:hypothetical protein